MGNFLESLKTQLNWNVRQAHLGTHYIDVQFDEPSVRKDDIPRFREQAEKIILSLSLQYRLGIRIFHFSCAHRGDRPAQPLLGPGEAAAPGFLANEILQMADLLDNEEAHSVAVALQNFYSQTTKAARLAIGWSCIEDIFGKGEPEVHLLDNDDLQLVLELIGKNLPALDENAVARKKKFIKLIGSWSHFKRKTRNVYIAEQIAPLLGKSVKETSKQIGKVTRLRSKLIHQSAVERRISTIDAEQFIEAALRRKWEALTGYTIPSWWGVDPFWESPQD